MAFCPNCGKNVEDGTLFCDNCGARLGENEQPQSSPDHIYVEPAPTAPAKKKGIDLKVITAKIPKNVGKIPTKFLLAGVAGVLVLAIVLGIALPAILSGGGSQDFVLYAKEGEIFSVDNKGKNPWQITDELLEDTSVTEEGLASRAYILNSYIQIRNGGKTLFYLDNIDDGADGATIFYRDLNNTKKEPVKLDTDINSFYANEKGTAVVYTANDDLYIRELSAEKEERIAKDVEDFMASDDCKTVLYVDYDDKLYVWTAKNGEEKISGNVTELVHVSEDFSKVYYMKDDVLRLWTAKEDIKIASDIYNVLTVTEDGKIYYTVDETEDVDVMDYISDKNASADAALVEPDWDTIRAQHSSYSEASDAYYAAWDVYNEKLERDYLREQIPAYEYSGMFYKLYYFDGKESNPVGDGYVNYTRAASEAAVVVFSTCDYSSVNIDLEDISYPSAVEYAFEDAAAESCTWFVASGNKIAPVALEGEANVRCDEKGEVFYFAMIHEDKVETDEDGYETVTPSYEADLYRVAVSGGNAKTPEMVDEDIYRSSITVIDGKTVVYFKDRDEETYEADMYINGENVDEDVVTGSVIVNDEDGAIAYRTDVDDEGLGTLKYYKKGEAVELAEDVRTYYFFPTGEMYYLADYSTKRSYGDLYFFNGKKAVKLDEDVTALLTIAVQ